MAGQRTKRISTHRDHWAFWLILLLGLAVRLWRFGALPAGFNQDEAFAGYEAWSLLRCGMDSAGYAWPVYLTAWGSGMNALETYLTLPFLALFGRQAWAVRLPQLIVGCLSLPALYGTVRRCADRGTALWAMLLLAICPWHILLSRWALESNLAPGLLLFGTYFFLRGLEDSRYLIPSALLYGLALYAYATIWPILPFVLLAQGLYCYRRGRLKPDRYLLVALLLLFLPALPLLLFLAVNLGWMEEIRTPFLSIPKLLVLRSGEISLRHIPENLKNLFAILWTQSDGLPWNSAGSVQGAERIREGLGDMLRFGGLYGLFYILTPPFVLLGLLRCLLRLRDGERDFKPAVLLLIWLLVGLVLGALVHVNINRVNILFLPLLILAAVGLRWFGSLFHGRLTPLLLAAYLFLFGSFCGLYYFRADSGYQTQMRYAFGDGLDRALEAAMEQEGTVVLDGHIYYSTVLFYSGTPVEDFRATVAYERYPAAYLSPTSFTRFRFGCGGGVPEEGSCCYILSPWTDGSGLKAEGFRAEEFGIYTLWTR